MARSSSTNEITLKLGIRHQQEIKDVLDDVECRIYDWMHGSGHHNWKHYKTSINEHLNIKCDKSDPIKNITIHSIDDPNNKKCKVWRATAYLPSITPKKAIQCYTVPKYHLEYDDLNTMKKLQQFTVDIEPENGEEYNINVAVTNPKLNGWISSRLCVNICCSKYSHKMNAYCCFGTFMKDSMLHQLKHKLYITSQDMKHTLSKNLNLYWSAKPRIIDTLKLMEITYILQINNGGWIPQWAVEMGLIDQHMIAIFKQITKWLNYTANIELSGIDAEKEEDYVCNDERMDDVETISTIDNVEQISDCKLSESEIGALSADSNIVSFTKFIDSKCVDDWIDLSDESSLLSMKAKHELYGNLRQRVMHHVVYNKIEDLEIESDDADQDIEIVEMQDLIMDRVVDDDDTLLSDGVYVDDADTLRKEAHRCLCLVDTKHDCCIM